MKILNWKPLEERRAQLKLQMFFKGKMNLVNIPFGHIQNNPRKLNNFAIPASNVDSHLHSFYPSSIRLWNSLPAKGKCIAEADAFKKFITSTTMRSAYC